jgi:iron complex transport system substrate-binding protein
VGRNTFVGDLITVAGAHNILDDAPVDWPTVSLETVVRRNPDVIIWTRSREVPAWSAAVAAHPEWKRVRAVRNGRVLELDGNLFNRPGPRLGHAARVLSDALDSIARLPAVP